MTRLSEDISPGQLDIYTPLKLSWIAAAVAIFLNVLVNGVVGQYVHSELVVYESLLLGMLAFGGATAAYVLGWTALYHSHPGRLLWYRIFGGVMSVLYALQSVLPFGPWNGWPTIAEFAADSDPRAYFGVSGTVMENLVQTLNIFLQGYLILNIHSAAPLSS